MLCSIQDKFIIISIIIFLLLLLLLVLLWQGWCYEVDTYIREKVIAWESSQPK